MRVIIIIVTSLLTALFSAGLVVAYFYFTYPDHDMLVYAFVMIFGSTVIPIFVTACVFSYLKKYFSSFNKIAAYFLELVYLLFFSVLGLCLMSLMSALSYYSGFSGPIFARMQHEFDESYRGFVPDLVLYCFLIPLIFRWIESSLSKPAKSRVE